MSLLYYGVCILAVVLGWCLLRAAKKGDNALDLVDLEIQAQQSASPLKQEPTSENLDVTTNPDLNILAPTKPAFLSDEKSAETMASSHRQLQENKGESRCERSPIPSVLLQTKWNKTETGQKLQWSRMTLHQKMENYRVSSLSDENGEERLTSLESDRKLH